MTSINPYLIRAWFEWMEDHGLSAHLVVATDVDDVEVPTEFIKDDQIVLCIDSQAVDDLELGNQQISFLASFNTQLRRCVFPIHAVRAIYDLDSGNGTMMPVIEAPEVEMSDADGGNGGASVGKTHMKIIK
jgi:stringent starvation protein B|tara:strand:+ start:2975 stop:3367 length:393 start_codon:yes stop_codon:yes gene_type:complete